MDATLLTILISFVTLILGYLLPYIHQFLATVYKPKRIRLCGVYDVYFCWVDENKKGSIAPMIAIIEKKIFYRYYGSFSDFHVIFANDVYHYEGKGYIENGHLCIDMESRGDLTLKVSTHHRYNLAKLQEKDYCFGLWLSIGSDLELSCGGTILKRKAISDDKKYIKQLKRKHEGKKAREKHIDVDDEEKRLSDEEIAKLVNKNYNSFNDFPIISLSHLPCTKDGECHREKCPRKELESVD